MSLFCRSCSIGTRIDRCEFSPAQQQQPRRHPPRLADPAPQLGRDRPPAQFGRFRFGVQMAARVDRPRGVNPRIARRVTQMRLLGTMLSTACRPTGTAVDTTAFARGRTARTDRRNGPTCPLGLARMRTRPAPAAPTSPHSALHAGAEHGAQQPHLRDASRDPGFHAARSIDARGHLYAEPEASELVLEAYPSPVRAGSAAAGGLTSRLLLLRGRETRSDLSLVPIEHDRQKRAHCSIGS